jgi:hypothetical protein
MKGPEERFDAGARIIPSQWMKSNSGNGTHEQRRARGHGAHQWMATLQIPLQPVRAAALQVFEDLGAEIAYRYEDESKVVIRCTLPQRQIRVELTPVDGLSSSTRIMVVASAGAEVDRPTSARILRAIECELEAA